MSLPVCGGVPAELVEAFASAQSCVIASEVVSVGFGITLSGMAAGCEPKLHRSEIDHEGLFAPSAGMSVLTMLFTEKQRCVFGEIHLPIGPAMPAARLVPDVLHIHFRQQFVHALDAVV